MYILISISVPQKGTSTDYIRTHKLIRNMITIIAEKPSVAKEIASIVKANSKREGYFEGSGYTVTWAYGHLISLDAPENYGYTGKWSNTQLPMIPEVFKISPIISTDKKFAKTMNVQLETISKLFRSSDKIIVATDAGREGELIFRYIYEYLNNKKKLNTPFVRLWISSLTDKAIREGLKNLKPGSEYDNLYQAGKARSEADWLIGMNGTRAVTINVADHTVWTVGRVQTPTLCMICKRYLENKNFTSVPFWTIKVEFLKGGLPFVALNITKFQKKEDADNIKNRLELARKGRVVKVEKKPAYTNPPLLYDLTSIQKDANSKLGLSADTTLKICQSLYEKKLITYPRTGSRYIPDDVYQTLPNLIRNLEKNHRFSEYAQKMTEIKLGKISVNANKVTDHHALLPTELIPKEKDMTELELKIYNMIAARMLESVSPREEKFVTTDIIIPEGMNSFPLIVKGSIIVEPGWKKVLDDRNKNEEDENDKLPQLTNDEWLDIQKVVVHEKYTKAPPLLTENSLLGLMETAGKELENEEEREVMKNIGIGTPATRAETIEKIIRTKYVIREKKNLIPTEKGLNLYQTIKDMLIANVEMTGKWENALGKIERGELDVSVFNNEIRNYTIKCTEELLNIKIEKTRDQRENKFGELSCPKCGKPFIVNDKICKCSDKDNCGYYFWRVICQRKLTEKDIKEIMQYGCTRQKVKLKKKDGKLFEARLILSKEGKFSFK